MENRKWEEELAGRWCEVLELVAGGSGAQAGEDSNQLSAISNQKEQRAKGRNPETENC